MPSSGLQFIIEDIDLAGAKSEAFVNIYGLLKQNIKSCNTERRRQRKQPKKLAKNNIPRAAHFFVHFFENCFARLLIRRFMEEMLYVFLFTFFFGNKPKHRREVTLSG